MSAITKPLRDLTKQNVTWKWENKHESSLTLLKEALVNARILKYFDSKKPIEIHCDASQNGLGACLFQEGHPVACASRSLTKAEERHLEV
ncbi:RNase H-like domain found in reverse transcriptase [Popillia japonica]|uniref:RNase H-like domain found in reverse transcriptase n=1 Tax=Popillia japonica TaxID=7064 RepID=A0AAW1N3T8_POPJA